MFKIRTDTKTQLLVPRHRELLEKVTATKLVRNSSLSPSWKQHVYFRVLRDSYQAIAFLSWLNPLHNFTLCFREIHLMLSFYIRPFPSGFTKKMSYVFLTSPMHAMLHNTPTLLP